MEQYLPSDELKALEAFAEAGGMSARRMIRQAAAACAEYIQKEFEPCRILVLCGTGNNACDGLVLASLLCDRYKVTVYQPVLGSQGSHCSFFRSEASKTDVTFTMMTEPDEYDLIIDAVFGIGLHLPLPESWQTIFKKVNESTKKVISLDIPSGVEADSGKCDPNSICADYTLTFTRKKIGTLVYPGAAKAGKVVLLDAGIPVPDGIHYRYCSVSDLSLYPSRAESAHKGTFGTLCIFAGSVGMAGAAYLSALAAYRTGVGMVKIVAPNENRTILQTMLPEAVLVCYDSQAPDFRKIEKDLCGCSALVAGPGIGTDEVSMQILTLLLSIFDEKKTVLDADALNLFAKHQMPLPNNVVITPHPKEFSRLCSIEVCDILASGLAHCMDYAKNHSVVTLLKGAHTVIADAKGNVRINLTGNNGMATAGSGDVLSGIIGALLCLGLAPLDAASLGAFIHGKAGDIAAETIGKPSLMASDMANAIAQVLKEK